MLRADGKIPTHSYSQYQPTFMPSELSRQGITHTWSSYYLLSAMRIIVTCGQCGIHTSVHISIPTLASFPGSPPFLLFVRAKQKPGNEALSLYCVGVMSNLLISIFRFLFYLPSNLILKWSVKLKIYQLSNICCIQVYRYHGSNYELKDGSIDWHLKPGNCCDILSRICCTPWEFAPGQ